MIRTRPPAAVPEPKVWSVDELGGPNCCTRLAVPAGIGDISWVYSKVRQLKALTGRETVIYLPGEQPRRGHQMFDLLPEVRWGGWLADRGSWEIAIQTLPADWPEHHGLALLMQPGLMNLAPNLHLEQGRKLRDWLPALPTEYHYPLAFEEAAAEQARRIMRRLPCPSLGVYLSNRDKDRLRGGGWSLWSAEQWLAVLTDLETAPELRGCGFVILGAEWDRDKSTWVADRLLERFPGRVEKVVGESLGVALRCLESCQYGLWYPSGIGILGNVLRVPGVMLLPWVLKGLETAYADPHDLARQAYRAWAGATPREVSEWVRDVSLPMVYGAGWRPKAAQAD